MGGPARTRGAVAALIAMRIVYAINWLNIGAIFYAMEPDLHAGVVGLGTLTSSFYLGIGLLQVPGGLMAAKWGPRKIVVLGTMIASVGALATGFVGDIWVAAALRFIVGGGMAFVFAPAVVMIAGLLREGRSGLGIGLFNSAYDVGGIFALFVWGVLAGITGWRLSVELSGGLGIVTGLLISPMVPMDETKLEFRVTGSELKKVLADSRLIIIGFGMLSAGIGIVLISSFMEYYLIGVFGLPTASAGIITSMIVVIPIFSSVYAGRTYDRMKRPKLLMLISNLVMAVCLGLSAIQSVVAALVGTALAGLISGFAFTVGFAAAKDFNRASSEYDSLAIAWVNCVSLFGAFIPPVVFSYAVTLSGYPNAWAIGALMTLVFTVPLLFLREGKSN